MRYFETSQSTQVTKFELKDYARKHFGSISKEKKKKIIIEDPQSDIAKKIIIEHKNKNKIGLKINTLSIKKLKEKKLLSNVPNLNRSKNNFLRNITGRTVSDRKRKMKKEVMESNFN